MKKAFIRDEKEFARKLGILKKGGAANLHLIADYDRTITQYLIGVNEADSSSYGLVESMLPKENQKEFRALFDHYYPLECSVELTHEEKAKLMEEWWKIYYEKIIKLKLGKKAIDEHIRKNRTPFRENSRELFRLLRKKNIPLLIFSAGVGNVILESMKLEGVQDPRVHVVSNFILFKDGVSSGHTTPLITSFNKNESHVKHEVYKSQVAGRKNVILIGDSLGDVTMADGMSHDCVIRIGFLNSEVEKRLDAYKKHFDVVLVEDNTMDFVNELLEGIE